MSPKKLPPAIPPSLGASRRKEISSAASPESNVALPEPVAEAGAAATKRAPPPRPRKERSAAQSVSVSPAAIEPAAALPATTDRVSGGQPDSGVTVKRPAPAPAISVAAPPASARYQVDPALRRRRALGVVDRYTKYSALICLIPIPLVDFAAVTAVVVRMAKVLSDQYGVPFEQARVRAFVSGMLGGVAAPSLAALGTASAVKLVPGVQLVGLAVTSATAAAWTRGMGEMFVQAFEADQGLATRSS